MIGQRNILREFVTINRGTVGGGGETRIGDQNLIMAYVHVAHDCQIGSHTIFGPGATLGGHVAIADFAAISAYSGVHQFCRVGRHAFIGGYSVITKDALPFGKTVGNRPARIFGLNTVGLVRRGLSQETIRQLGAHSLSGVVEAEHVRALVKNRAGFSLPAQGRTSSSSSARRARSSFDGGTPHEELVPKE